MGKYIWPCPQFSNISSGYGNRICPFHGQEFHDGIDLAAASGTPILAAAPGTVSKSGWNGGYGNYISITHEGGLMSFYAHCSALYAAQGAKVSAGQKIAAVGTTGSSTGCHLHFGMHKNGSSVNPLSYVAEQDTAANYSGAKNTTAQAVNRVKAMYTAYYPYPGADHDAMGNLVDPAKLTCAAPASIPFQTKITISDTGTAQDGLTYTVTDRGGAVTIENGVYHFDLLMSTKSECLNWGVKYGSAIIGEASNANGETLESTETEKEISTVVVKSVSGTAASQKLNLSEMPSYLRNGVELLIQNDQIYLPCLEGEVTLERFRKDSPAKLEFTVVKDEIINFQEGNPVLMRYNGQPVFQGFVFTKSRSDYHLIKVTAYDQIRYLKNKDTLSYENKTYSELLQMIAADYGLKTGIIEDTKFKIEQRLEEGTLLDMLQTASDLTFLHTGKLYILFDDFGRLTLRNIQDLRLNLLVDEITAQSYTYSSSIDNEVYNKIKLSVDNSETGEREAYVFNDTSNQGAWGQLQFYKKLDNGTNEAAIKNEAKVLLKYYNKKNRSLQIKGILGDIRVQGGSFLAVKMKLGDLDLSNYMCVEKVKHKFIHGLHTMDCTLFGFRGEFRV